MLAVARLATPARLSSTVAVAATVSMLIASAAVFRLPAKSAAVTLMVLTPWPIAATSAATSV